MDRPTTQNSRGGLLGALLLVFIVVLVLARCGRDEAQHAAWKAQVDDIRADVVAGRRPSGTP